MSEKLYEALEVCLNALETGADMEAVLKRFPELKDELAPILKASQQAKMLAVPEVSEKAFQRGKMHVLQQANEKRNAVAKPRQRWAMFTFPRLASSLAVAFVLLLSGTGLVRASDAALPGDNLYPVKRTWEDVRLAFSFDSKIREELEGEFEGERLHEIDELLDEGRHETIKFSGIVTEQDGDQWVVSGIPVQITSNSNLPVEAVVVGASIMVEGRTNEQGFVVAGRVEILGAGLALPRYVPTEIEGSEESNRNGNSSIEAEDNSNQDDLKTSSDDNENGIEDNKNESGKSSSDEDKSDDSNSVSDGEDGGGDNHNDDNEDHGDNSGSGGGGEENDNGDSH